MKIKQFLLFASVLLIVGCDKNLRECDDYTPFEDTPGLRKYYTPNYSIMFLTDSEVQINTYFDDNEIVRKGTYEYEILDIDCYCAGGEDIEGNCSYPTAKYIGSGTIDIASSNDSICTSKKLYLSFEITRIYSDISITDYDCFDIRFLDRN